MTAEKLGSEAQLPPLTQGGIIRELVARTAIDHYFQVVSSQSRVAATEAQLMRAKTLHERALDLKAAGIVPGIDVLRAEVERRTMEQRLIQAKNTVEKQKPGSREPSACPWNRAHISPPKRCVSFRAKSSLTSNFLPGGAS